MVVVDAVEGVCIQTRAVLRQARQEKMRFGGQGLLVSNACDARIAATERSLPRIRKQVQILSALLKEDKD